MLFVFREEYYLKNRKPKEGTEEFFKWQAEMEQIAGRAEVIIGKQRHGPTGTVELQFEAEVTRFSSLARDDHLPERAMTERSAATRLSRCAAGAAAHHRPRRAGARTGGACAAAAAPARMRAPWSRPTPTGSASSRRCRRSSPPAAAPSSSRCPEEGRARARGRAGRDDLCAERLLRRRRPSSIATPSCGRCSTAPDEHRGWAARDGGRPSALQVDTGMNRLGLAARSAASSPPPGAARPRSRALVMSHLACADEPAHPMNAAQLALFREIRDELPEAPGLARQLRRHLSRRRLSLRPGAARDRALRRGVRRRPAAARSRRHRRGAHPAGARRGGRRDRRLRRGRTPRPKTRRIAILSAGYADGYHRARRIERCAPGASVFVAAAPAPHRRPRLDGPDRGRRDAASRRASRRRLGRAFRPEPADRRGRRAPPAPSATSS